MTAITDLAFFSQLVKAGNFTRAAQELGNTPAAVSKRLAVIERRLGVRLLQRTTRSIGLTPEGEMYLVEGTRVLADRRRWNAQSRAAASSPPACCAWPRRWDSAASTSRRRSPASRAGFPRSRCNCS